MKSKVKKILNQLSENHNQVGANSFLESLKLNELSSNIKNGSNDLSKIFTGATWYNPEYGNMTLTVKGDKVYGVCDEFDFERNSKKEALAQLKKWKFDYIGVD